MATRKRKPAIRARRGRVDGGRKARYGSVLPRVRDRQCWTDDSGPISRTTQKHVTPVAEEVVCSLGRRAVTTTPPRFSCC